MKKLIIASAICMLPLFLVSVVIPILTLTSLLKETRISETAFWITMLVMCICLSIIMATTLFMLKYADTIDLLDKERQSLYNKNNELNSLIKKYNELIISNS